MKNQLSIIYIDAEMVVVSSVIMPPLTLMNKKDIRGDTIREVLRIIDDYPFPNDRYNLLKDTLFFKVARLL